MSEVTPSLKLTLRLAPTPSYPLAEAFSSEENGEEWGNWPKSVDWVELTCPESLAHPLLVRSLLNNGKSIQQNGWLRTFNIGQKELRRHLEQGRSVAKSVGRLVRC